MADSMQISCKTAGKGGYFRPLPSAPPKRGAFHIERKSENDASSGHALRLGAGSSSTSQVSMGKEVLTLQFGSFANYVGAHYWNFQVRAF